MLAQEEHCGVPVTEDHAEPTTPDFTIPITLGGESDTFELLMKYVRTNGFCWMAWSRAYRNRFAECLDDDTFVRVYRRVSGLWNQGERDGFEAPADRGEIEEAFRRLKVVMTYWAKKIAAEAAVSEGSTE